MLFLRNRANGVQTFKMVQKSRSREHGDIIIINYIDKKIERASTVPARESRPETSTCEVPRDVWRKLQPTLCAIMAS